MRFNRLFVALLVLMATVVVAAPASGASSVYQTPLDGDEEVPANDSRGRGHAIFTVSGDGESIDYKLLVWNIEDVIAAHIHLAPEGVNGPVVVLLFSGAPDGFTTGVLAEGTITQEDLSGPLAGMGLDDLIAAMDAGDTYVNVHTTAFPGGEIRGQID
jgi:CHRD domain